MPSQDKTAPDFQPEAYGRYYLVDKIAVGGMAEVFKARRFSDGGFQMLLVIKRILEQFSANDEFVQMFVDEAKISVQLQHPNIVQIHDFGKLANNYFIAMECVEGKDLKGLLRALAHRRKLLPQEFAVYIAHEVCKGLDYAHKKADIQGRPLNIVHRDISPSNILLSYGGDVKIADFGIAKAQTSAYTTKDGVLKGKFEYMSPEQASGKSATASSDIFSAGILLHEMLTGRRLFKTDADVKTLEKIKSLDIQPPSARNPRVPAALDALVMKALSVDPAARFRDAKEMQLALAEHLYPATPSMTGDSLGDFLQELFRDDIHAERQRLQMGTQLATTLHEQANAPDMATEEWTAGFTAATLQIQQQQAEADAERAPQRSPALLALLAILLLGAIGFGGYILSQPPAEVAPEAPDVGTLHVQIRPEGTQARFLINGEAVSTGTSLMHAVSPEAPVTLRIEADGFQAHEEELSVEAGERLRLPVTLLPVAAEPAPEPEVRPTVRPVPAPAPAPEPDEEPEPAVQPPRISFSSSPRGASVFVDGRLLGKTPMTWTRGTAAARHSVEYQLDGYQSVSFSMTVPSEGRRDGHNKTLQPVAQDPGRLRVQVKGGWANVFVDGAPAGETPLTIKLPPGKHSVKVENPETGYSNSKSVTITSGELSVVAL